MTLSLGTELSLTLRTDQQQDDPPEKPVCSNCRSSEVTFDASACWNAEEQKFEYDIHKGNVFCLDCAEEHMPEWVAV